MIDPNDDLYGWYAEATNAAIYRAPEGWYWQMACFRRAIGPFKSEEDARDDLKNVMGLWT